MGVHNRRWHVLEDLIREHGWKVGVELGVLKGQIFLYLLQRCPDLMLYGVDIWKPRPEQEKLREVGGRSYSEHDLAQYEADVRKASEEYGDRARLIKGWTVNVAQELPDKYFDFVFIDADHTYEGVISDIVAWYPKVKEGGALCGHDYHNPPFPGVTEAVDELCPGAFEYSDHVWMFPLVGY